MKKTIFVMMAAAALLLGVTSCAKEDDNASKIQEEDLVGLWWDEYEYADVTANGVPFSRVLLAVDVAADHTGCIYLGVFNDTEENPLAIYGGPKDAAFTWQLLGDGKVVLSDPDGGSIALAPRRSGTGDSYGNDMTNVNNTNMNYTNNGVTVTNNSYSGTLTKADGNKQSDINDKLRVLIIAVNGGGTGLGYNGYGTDTARAPQSQR